MKNILSHLLSLLIGLLIFLGLPLLGWGLDAVRQFFSNPARLAYALVILALQVFALFYNPQVGRNPEQRKPGIQQHKLDLVLIQVFSLAVVFLAPLSDRHSFAVFSYGDLVRLAGFLLLIPGFSLMQMAEKHLARQFSIQVTLQQDHQLIQSGPYKMVRHPRYLGILAFFLGIAVVFRSWLAVLVAAALFGVLLWRIRAEEALLEQTFGAEWQAYRTKSWRLIPYIF